MIILDGRKTRNDIKDEIAESVKEIVAKFKAGSADFHQTVADMAQIERSQAKTINLGLFYGMGKAKLQAELGVSKEKAEELFNQYHSKVPFVKQLTNKVMNVAQDRGNIKTLLGRRCRFPKYEPVLRGSDWGTFVPAEDHERMLELQEMGEFLKDEEHLFHKLQEIHHLTIYQGFQFFLQLLLLLLMKLRI